MTALIEVTIDAKFTIVVYSWTQKHYSGQACWVTISIFSHISIRSGVTTVEYSCI